MTTASLEFPLYISFDPVQVTILNTMPSPTIRFSYLSRNQYGPLEIAHDLPLPHNTISLFIKLIERLPENNYRGNLFLPQGSWIIKFIKHSPSENPYLDLVRGRLYRKLLFFNVPVRPFKVRVKSLETLLIALRALSHAA